MRGPGILRRAGAVVALVFAVAVGWPAIAQAQLFWSDGSGIGQANLDGSAPSEGFIPNGVDGDLAAAGSYVYWASGSAIGRANLNGSSANPSFISGITAGSVAVSGSYIYWSQCTDTPPLPYSASIGRANLDGSGIDQDFINLVPSDACPSDLAVSGSYLYWSDFHQVAIGRAGIDGSGVTADFVPVGNDTLSSVAVDGTSIYWGMNGAIGEANINGSGTNNNLITTTSGQILGLAVDDSHLYWTNYNADEIGWSDLDGSDPNQDLVTTTSSPVGVAVPVNQLVVNSTALDRDTVEAAAGVCNASPGGSTPVCTLPQAILTSNAVGGAPISFDIPSGGSVPQIEDPTGLAIPPLSAPTSIDGTTQPGAGKVELSGAVTSAGITVGLTVGSGASGTTIRGMVINGYSEQIALSGGDDTIQGDELGVDPAGSTAVAGPFASYVLNQVDIALDSSGSQIGGTAAGQGNVLGTGWADLSDALASAGIVDLPSASGNVIQGNRIGVQAGNAGPLISPEAPNALPADALDLAGHETVGGSAEGAGNTIAPGANIAGASVVQGNTFLGPLSVSADATIGGPTLEPGTGVGNSFLAPIVPELSTSHELTLTSPAVVQGNTFTGDANGGVEINTDGATIGGPLTLAGNAIENNATLPPEPSSDTQPFEHAGIEIRGSHNLVEHNVLRGNDDDGAVDVYSGTGNTITDNAFTDNANGILLGTDGFVIETDVSRSPGGPNDSEYYPILFSTTSSGGATTVRGRIPQPGAVAVALYSQAGCPLADHAAPQGADFLGSQQVSSRLGGEDFTLRFAPVAPGQGAITATATGEDGSTSQFSPCLKTDSRAAQFTDVGVEVESGGSIPIVPTTSNSDDIARAARRPGKPAGRGVLELLCPPITTNGCTGTVVVRTTGRHPTIVAHTKFHMPGGFAFPARLSLSAVLLAQLRHHHRLMVKATITAHDGGRHEHHKTTHARLKLVYK